MSSPGKFYNLPTQLYNNRDLGENITPVVKHRINQ